MARATVRQRLRYRFDNTMSRGTPALVAWLGVATLILIAIFSAVVLIGNLAPVSEDGGRPGTVDQAFKSLLHALDPGTVAGDTGSWQFLLTMLILTLAGLFVVSALIGVLATGLDARLHELRKGRSFVVERDHTLILGWSDTIFTILSELAIANENEPDPVVVILADHDKVEMEDAIREKVGDTGRTRVVCRSGTPIDLSDLGMVNPQGARSVIVLASERAADADVQVIKAVLALTKGPHGREGGYHIVAEITDPSNLEAARLVGGEQTILVDKRQTISRLIVQSSRQSGVSVVYTELLDFSGAEVYFRDDPALVGRAYADALHAYDDCSVIGVAHTEGGVKLNPPPDTPIGPGDRLVAIAEDDEQLLAAVAGEGPVQEDAIVAAPPRADAPERVLLLGWNGRGPSVVRELDEFAMPGARVTVVADLPGVADTIALECGDLRNLALDVREASTTDRRTLDSLGAEAYDNVIVLCYSDHLDAQQADARTLVTLLHLRDIASRAGETISIVSEMLDDRNRQLAEVTKVDDVIVSDKVLSLMLAQISENAHLKDVFEELFSAAGSEIYLRPAGDYVATGRPLAFRTVVEAARRRGETAIGYRVKDGSDDPAQGYGVRINPRKSGEVTLGEEDRVIVLAED